MKLTKTTLKNFKQHFLDYKDPVGVVFAEKHLGGYSELQRLLKFNWFSTEWTKWQEDLRAKIKSEALTRIQEISSEGSAQSLNAAKYLANGEYEETKNTKGRPTKEMIKGELKRQVEAVQAVNEDYKRMTGLPVTRLAGWNPVTVVQGGKQ